MASQIYNVAKKGLLDGGIDWDTDDIRAVLLMDTTTADTENSGIATVSDFTTLGESDDNGYSRQALASEAANRDDANDRAELDAADSSFTLNGDGTETNYVGVLLYKHVTDDTDSVPIAFVEFGSTIAMTATQIDVPWDAQGILQLTSSDVIYNVAKKGLADGTIDLADDDIRCVLLMDTTTADTENDSIDDLADFSVLGESDDTGYAREALAGEAVTQDDANGRAEWDATDESFALNGDGTETNYVGVLYYKHVTNDADSIPIAYHPFDNPIAMSATQIDLPFDAQGILHLT
jgi:hypothetical protein